MELSFIVTLPPSSPSYLLFTDYQTNPPLTGAAEEGLLGPSIHLGIRTRLTGIEDYQHDLKVGFQLVTTDAIDEIGTKGIKELVRQRVVASGVDRRRPVYISLDIDVVDPAHAPATGTPESAGWTSREVILLPFNFNHSITHY